MATENNLFSTANTLPKITVGAKMLYSVVVCEIYLVKMMKTLDKQLDQFITLEKKHSSLESVVARIINCATQEKLLGVGEQVEGAPED